MRGRGGPIPALGPAGAGSGGRGAPGARAAPGPGGRCPPLGTRRGRAAAAMSVVQRLAAGWLLDHLSFINRSGYETRRGAARPPAAAPRAAPGDGPGPGPGPGGAAAAGGEAARTRYVFREEFFDVPRPHLAAAAPEPQRPGRPAASAPGAEAGSSREERGAGASAAGARKVRPPVPLGTANRSPRTARRGRCPAGSGCPRLAKGAGPVPQ